MSRSNSGRVVVDIDVSLKKQLYAQLSIDGLTLKEFFLSSVKAYIEKGGTGASTKIEAASSGNHSNKTE